MLEQLGADAVGHASRDAQQRLGLVLGSCRCPDASASSENTSAFDRASPTGSITGRPSSRVIGP